MKKTILAVFLLSLLSCTKSNDNLAMLPKGTRCTIVSGIFATGAFQPIPPLVVVDVYQQDGGLTLYDVSDSNGKIWQIPGNDLVVIK